MTIKLQIQNNMQVLMPVRFDRRRQGRPRASEPDIDDRGFAMPRPGGWVSTSARGPMFTIAVGDEVTLRVVREDIDPAAELYVIAGASTSPQFEVTAPAAGTPLPANGEFTVRGVDDNSTAQVLEIRFGAVDGPVIAEAEPHVFDLRVVNVRVHVCTIHRAATAAAGAGSVPQLGGAAINVSRLMRMAAAVWRHAGVRLRFSTQNDTYTGFLADDFAQWNSAGGAGSEAAVTGPNFVANRVNLYLIRFMHNSLGVGMHRGNMATESWTQPGCIVGVEGSKPSVAGAPSLRASTGGDLYQEVANDIAHEIGHFFTLTHAGNVNNPGLNDTYARRQLMHPINLLPSAASPDPRFNDIGYGTGAGGRGHRGCLLTLKRFTTHANDGEVARARRRIDSGSLY